MAAFAAWRPCLQDVLFRTSGRRLQDVLKCGPAEVLEMCQARHHAGLVRAFADAGCQIGGGVSAGHTGGTMEAAAAAVARGGHARLLHVVRQLAGVRCIYQG